ncbi:bifunctional methionine sulfoxide reductase B/A protein [Paraferrimonas haliotis]|uniref:Peptide methionine sulfoxide reductase MsrA n=1 Tax=Paraferrimonas haliotis TaxID=2013866 RepID=A0AA37TRM8_9GAMM|nr:bifunctional methionine sulfoxide reductase B/A protein [Paraferrimonas haliotis]GLS84413.1 peptide methionine sulfoxide reductase MsrA [Paraferrimonas haliotis]
MPYKKLTEAQRHIIEDKGTEPPFSGEYDDFYQAGRYHCGRCDAPLYLGQDKFNAGCGWPAFDDEIPGQVKRLRDADGRRTEIVCNQCDAHLGHVFEGERLTDKNTRHCVNSLSLDFKPIESAVLGGGCFWCIEATLQQAKGVLSVTPGYAGGESDNPSYQQVCGGQTGHAEVVMVEFDPSIISYQTLLRLFFASHDPTTLNRQGNDVGSQYRSIILTQSDQQAATALSVITNIQDWFDSPVVTDIEPLSRFYPAESKHKDYFRRNSEQAYCQVVIAPKLAKFRQQMAQYLVSDDSC